MSNLTLLSDAELDAVSGGILNAGDGGDGGTNEVGVFFANNGDAGFKKAKVVVAGNTSTANGGNGGNVVIKVRVGGWY